MTSFSIRRGNQASQKPLRDIATHHHVLEGSSGAQLHSMVGLCKQPSRSADIIAVILTCLPKDVRTACHSTLTLGQIDLSQSSSDVTQHDWFPLYQSRLGARASRMATGLHVVNATPRIAFRPPYSIRYISVAMTRFAPAVGLDAEASRKWPVACRQL